MVALQLNTLYNYFQQALLNNSSSSSSFATLILQAHKRVQDTLQSRKKLKSNQTQKLHILYPARSPVLETDHFFSTAETMVQQRTFQDIKQQSHAGPITANYRAPREPIVLCHGLFGFDVRGPQTIPALQFHYWGGIEDALAKLGAKIIVTRVPQAGSIWERSQALHTMLKTILVGKKVNFVAHSMVYIDIYVYL